MKAYIIEIQLIDAMPKVLRKVIVPAGITFYRLHQVIQTVTNFQSLYSDMRYHLFQFDLTEENMVVTDDDLHYEEHKAFMANRRQEELRLLEMDPEKRKFEQRRHEMLKQTVRRPQTLTIDDYIEKHRDFVYLYDFGDGWALHIQLIDIVDDYYFGYPTLIDGTGDAPPEDVGGIPGFEHFLKAIDDPDDPEHKEMKSWAESDFRFKRYYPDHINSLLKHLNFKKTEWEKIDHKNYRIISNKYRKAEV